MQIIKTVGNTLAAAGQTVQDVAQLGSIIVGDQGLKHTTIQSFALINTALDESVLIAQAESEWNIAEFKRTHAIRKAGRPKNHKKSTNVS
jgi:hypothetical protein